MAPRPRRSSVSAIGCALLALLAGAVNADSPPAGAARRVDRAALMETVRALSSPEFGGRRTGTPGAKAARHYLAGRFQAAGLKPAFAGTYLQSFRTTSGLDAANVVGIVEGRDPAGSAIVVTAHYDHLGIVDGQLHPGADDNASGVAALLAAAEYFAGNRPYRPLVFAALDAEELGFEGAHAFLAAPPLPRERIALNVNLDMLARSDQREVVAAGTSYAPCLLPVLREVQRRTPVRIVPGRDRPSRIPREDWTDLSDHVVFHRAGIPFLYFGVEDHADYHQPGDTAGKIDPDFFGDVADLVVDTLVTLDREPVPSRKLCTGV